MQGGYKFAILGVVFFAAIMLSDSAYARVNLYAPSTDITEPATWTKDEGPYVISGWGWLDVKSSLTIEPGTVIKFTPNHYMRRYNGILVSEGGKIIANGTSTAPIIFTSYYDDSAGGDTNGDGSGTTPIAGDWRGIVFDNDESELSFVEIRYAGNQYESYGAIEARNNSQLSLSNSIIQHSGVSGLRLNEPIAVAISDSAISNSADFAFYSTVSGSEIILRNIVFQDNADGIATLSVGNTITLENPTFSGNAPVIELIGTSINNNAIWPSFDNNASYIIRNDIEIASDSVLTIEAGAIIKGEYGQYPDSRIEVYGRLIARGTETQPIIFTSLRDDTVGGDTNKDEDATSPALDDWGGLYFENSANSVLDYVEMRYGGRYLDDFSGSMYATTDYNMIHLKDSSLSVATSTIGIAKTAFYLEGGSVLTMSGSLVATTTTGILSSSSLESNISGSSFVNNSQYAINNSGAQIIAKNNWWGDNSGPYHVDNADGAGQRVAGDVAFEPWTVDRVPVILVPGIMGTELYKGDDKIWPDIEEMIKDYDDGFINILAMDAGGLPIDNQIVTRDIVRTAPTKDIFQGLISSLSDSGYQENNDLFVFPYDWRADIQTSSSKLKDKINEVVSQTNMNKVNIIAHSMGGLLTKQYILDNGTSTMDKIIFVGTPHLGAPKAAKALLFGDDMGIGLIFPFLSKDRIKYISQNMPSVYQLLPSVKYLSDIGSYYGELGSIGYNYTDMNQYFITEGLNSVLLGRAEDFHSESLDNFNITGLEIYNINGCDTPTISSIVKRNDGFDSEEYSLVMSAGDGTVPIGSSKAITVDSDKQFYFKNGWWIFNNIDHSEMPSTDGIKELITQIITESVINLPDNATQDSSECIIAGKLVSVHSPVNLHIYDSEGNHVGRGENGDIEYNISGVAYEEIGENKFVFLPADEAGQPEYRIELDGTDSGTFSLRVSKVENSEITETAYYSDIPVNASSEATVTLSDNVSSTVLQVDEAGSGNFEAVSVSSVLDSEQSSDTTKPNTTISVSGGTNSAVFTLSATDDNSGILKTEYSLDNGQTWNNYTDSVIINNIGSTEVLFRSKDRAGNLEDYKSQTIRVSSAAVIITPIQANSSRHPEGVSAPEGSRESAEVLGVEIERPQRERYSDEDILNALTNADIDILMDYLGQTRDLSLEQNVLSKYGNGLLFNHGSINFISYGTKSTRVLGKGERAGVIYSFKEAFNRLPDTNDDWNDLIRISTNQAPIQRNDEAEQRARDAGAEDGDSVLTVAYGIRPENRDLEKEAEGIVEFVKRYGRVPESTLDWNILRSIVYKN